MEGDDHHHTEIQYIRYEPDPHNDLLLPRVVGVYRAAFAALPWGEWKKCPKCQNRWAIEQRAELEATGFLCPDCGMAVDDYWPTAKVQQDILELRAKEASIWLALEGSTAVGFTWGYPRHLGEQFDRELGMPGLTDAIREAFPHAPDEFAYQSEIGVVARLRGRRIASQLFAHRHYDFLRRSLNFGVVRTKENPPSITYLWYTERMGYQVVARYTDGTNRVILARPLTNLVVKEPGRVMSHIT